MLNLYKHWLTGAMVGLILPIIPIYAADEPAPNAAEQWSGTFTVGLMTWSDLKDLEPAAGGGFESLGFALEIAGHKHVTNWGSADVLVGADFGLFTTESDIPGTSEDFTQRGLYLTPSMKIRYGERSARYLNLEAGLGWYELDFAELHCDTGCSEIADTFNKDILGGYLGISGGFGGWFIMGLKVHFADFGQVTGLGAGTGDLKGPIYILSLGGAFGA